MEQIIKKIKKNITKKDNVVVAVSGGADSMMLLSLLIKVREDKDFNIICAHINHGVRKASIKEEVFVRSFCEKNNITFEFSKINIKSGGNFHHEARKLRYHFLNHIVYKYNAKFLMTAHHGDDLIETVLMKIARGSTIKGYSGFNELTKINGYSIYRPLISVSKKEIYAYCKENNIKYVVDRSNFLNKYTRNRYRKYILPFLKKEDSNIHHKFLKYNQTIQEIVEYFDVVIENKMETILENGFLNLELFNKEYIAVKRAILQKMIEEKFKESVVEINQTHLDQILVLIDSKKTNSSFNLPNDIVAIKDYGRFTFQSKKDGVDYVLELTDGINLPNDMKIIFSDDNQSNGNDVARFDSNSLKHPLYIRNRRDGDKISVKGLKGRKKVSDIFTDEKVSHLKRKDWPILVDSDDNILWVPGIKKSVYDKSKEETYDIILKYVSK